MNTFCRTCSQVIADTDLCVHRNPVCGGCCDDEHPVGYHDDEWDVA